MATLDNLEFTAVPLIGRPPEKKVTDLGPEWIDAETAQRFGEQYAGGVISFAQNPGDLVASVSQEELNRLFVAHLRSSPLTSPFAIAHRVFALTKAIQHLIDANDQGVTPRGNAKPPTPGEIEIAATNLESWLAQASVSEYLPDDITDEQRQFIASTVSMIDERTLSTLTNITSQQLAGWRFKKVGPPYLKIAGQRRSIRYPVAGVLAWMYALVQQ